MTKPMLAAFDAALGSIPSTSAKLHPEVAGEPAELTWWSNAWNGGKNASAFVRYANGKSWQRSGLPTDVLTAMMAELAGADVRPWTLEVTVRPAKASVRDAVADAMIAAMKEARGELAWPSDEEMDRERKAFKKAAREKAKVQAAKRAGERAVRAGIEEKRRAAVIADAKAEAVGDVASLIEVLGRRLKDPGRLSKTMSMLKKDGFQLFSNLTDTQLEGVVKSQTEADLVYGCRLSSDGKFSCCTQNLNVCGGLRGQPCKHLLVLVVGLAQAGVMPVSQANDWMIATLVNAPELDREASADVFLKYRGAQAGELDWRPTETTPEDFYSY